MKVRARWLRAILATCAALLVVPAAALATEYCVAPASGCAGGTWDEVDTALDLAKNNGGRDTIRLGAKTYTSASPVTLDSPVDLVGAGVGQTIFDTTGTTYTMYANSLAEGSLIKDLTVRKANSAAQGLVLYSSSAENIEVAGDDTPNGLADSDDWIWFNGISGDLKNVKVVSPLGTNRYDWAVYVQAGTHTFENVELQGDNAIVQASGKTTVKRSRLTGHRTAGVHGSGTMAISDSVVRATAGSTADARALEASAHSAPARMELTSSTVVGNGTGEGARSMYHQCGNGAYALVLLVGTTVSGFPVSSNQIHGPGNGCIATNSGTNDVCPEPPAANSNTVQYTNSHRDGSIPAAGGCRGQKDVQGGPPGFVSDTDLRPRQPSPLIDTGPLGGEGVDLNGAPRVVDGDALGDARRDIGAFEYQRKAPSVAASASPASAGLNVPFAFSALGSDPDGETLQYIWTFSDGQAASGENVSKPFATAGPHTGTVQVIDGAGLSATSKASVTVTPAATPTPSPTPTPTPTPDLTAPAVTVKGGGLRVNARRKAKVTISCPVTETAPCQISIAVSSARKIALSGRKKKIASLGKGSGRVPNGKTATVTITLSKKAYRYLKRKRRLPARLAVTATDADGNSAKASASATLRVAKKKK